MATSSQIKRLATDPAAYFRFLTRGQLPKLVRPEGPLYDLLVSIGQRDLGAIIGVTVDSRLGYSGSRVFNTASQALRWVAPLPEVVEGTPWPSESWRIKQFTRKLYLQDLLSCASSWPAGLIQAYPRLDDTSDCAGGSNVEGDNSPPRLR